MRSMNNFDESMIPAPDCLAVGREKSIFAEDIEANYSQLIEMISGKRILAIGAAGSIGSNTIDTISRFNPSTLHVIDHNENGLAELVRNLRSRKAGLNVRDFKTFPLNYGNKAFEYYLNDNAPFDYILNFAALKHVRSEKDHYSILEMLSTNLILMSNLMEKLCDYNSPARFFSVSTDKAANPSSVMGASKRLMEHFLFDKSLPRPDDMDIVSARFANVAYSNGSLLQSFQNRLKLRQPLVAPKDCRRYFVSLRESGHICTLAAFIAPKDTIVIPNLNPEKSLVLLEDVLYGFLHNQGYEPVVYDDEEKARANVEYCAKKSQWPVILTALDTAGEKPYEEFFSETETVIDIGLSTLSAVIYEKSNFGDVSKVRDILKEILDNTPAENVGLNGLNKNMFRDLIASIEPGFLNTHKDAVGNLDQRM